MSTETPSLYRLYNLFHASGNLWTVMTALHCPWVSDVRNWPWLWVAHHQSKNYWSVPCLWIVALTGPWACGPLYLVAHQALDHTTKGRAPKLSASTETFLIQDGAKPGSSGLFHPENGMASLVLSLLLDAKCWISLPFSQTTQMSNPRQHRLAI